MTVAVKKWGNSMALRIPRDMVRSLRIENDSLVELRIDNGTMIVEPQRGSLLDDLVARIDPSNLHGEIDTGESVGHEAW